MTRMCIVLGAGLPVVLAAGSLVLRWDQEPVGRLARVQGQLHAENYPQVRDGMSQAEVERVLGGPSGNYGRYSDGSAWATCEAGPQGPPGSDYRVWCDDENQLEFSFDGEGRVVRRHRRASYHQNSPAERWWLFWDMKCEPFKIPALACLLMVVGVPSLRMIEILLRGRARDHPGAAPPI